MPPFDLRKRTSWLIAVFAIALLGVGLTLRTKAATPHEASSSIPATAWLLLGVVALVVVSAMSLRRAGEQDVEDAFRDPDSGLYKPAYVHEVLGQLMARDDRSGSSQLALVLLRIDYVDEFKRRYGVSAMRTLMRFAGRQIRGQLREGDLPMRDGDGFAVYLQCEHPDQAEAFCRRLHMLLAREQFALHGDEIKLSLCAGVAVREVGEHVDSLYGRALKNFS